MSIRKMTRSDVRAASQTCQASFMKHVAPTVSPEGVNTFLKVISKRSMCNLVRAKHYDLYVYEEEQHILGVAAVRDRCHLSLLFVTPEQHFKGIGKRLFEHILSDCQTSPITVKAALPSVAFYRKLGFQPTGPETTESGLIFQPMERLVNKSPVPRQSYYCKC